MLVVDLQPMRVQQSGADQAFLARADEYFGKQFFLEPLEAHSIAEIFKTLLRGEFRLKRSQRDQVAVLRISSPTISRNPAGEPMGVSPRTCFDEDSSGA